MTAIATVVSGPNEGQQKAADAFFEFLLSDQREFIISGAAGVGKTFLMSHIIDAIMPRYLEMCRMLGMEAKYDQVVMTATTNKAAEVLSASTKRPTSTIHSFLNLRIKENYKTGEVDLIRTNQWHVHERKIIFVDECSMIDAELYRQLHDATANSKLVFVGDHNQLAPVKDTLSPVYKHDAPFFELTQPMRNAGQPALMALCQQLRDTVAGGEFKPIQAVPGVIDVLDDRDMQFAIDVVFKQQTMDARILAYTNKRVMEYNDHVRGLRQLPGSYQVGELLVNNNAIQLQKTMIPVEAGIEVTRNHGSDMMLVDTVDEQEVRIEVDYLDLYADCGETFTRVPVPVDRAHYEALVKFYKGQKNWNRHFWLKSKIADLRPRDAATVHKSQGSTYDLVFVDLDNIGTCHQPDQVARMLYVAFSRARSRIFLYGNPGSRYGGPVLE